MDSIAFHFMFEITFLYKVGVIVSGYTKFRYIHREKLFLIAIKDSITIS